MDNTSKTVTNKHLLSDSRLHQLVPKIRRLTKTDKILIRKENISVKNGKFTDKENKILIKNWQLFCNDHCINEPHYVLGFFINGDNISKTDKEYVKYLRNDCDLFLRLAKGLPNRTLQAVYQRSRQIFSGLDRSEDLSAEGRQHVIDLHKRFSRQWTKIAEQSLCHPKSVQQIIRNKFTANGVKVRNGKWTEKEENRLIKAIKKVLNVDALTVDNCDDITNISWTSVANFVKKRSPAQCRQHWYSRVYFRIRDPHFNNINRYWNKKLDSLKLVYFMKYHNYETEEDIDWDLLKEKFADIVNFNKLSRIWRDMKASVPDQRSKKFREVIEWLYHNKLSRFSVTDDDHEKLEKFCNDSHD